MPSVPPETPAGDEPTDESWERPRPTARQQRRDVVVGLGLAAGTLLSLVLSASLWSEDAPGPPPVPEQVAWCLAVSLPLAARRRFPLATLVTCSVALVGMQARFVPEAQMASVCLFLALFTAGAWGRDRTLTRGVRAVVVAAMFAWLAFSLFTTVWRDPDREAGASGPLPPHTATVLYSTAINVLYFAAALGFGNLAWNQARTHALLAQRNVELTRERDENARRAVLDERVRIARELHDVVAHHVSVMGVQAGAARRVLDRDPELTRRVLAGIESSGREAVTEMRRLLGVLRGAEEREAPRELPTHAAPGPGDIPVPGGIPGPGGIPVPDSDRSPAPGLDSLEALVERTRSAGLEVALTVVGEPSAPLAPSLQLAAYRIVQEALTNTVRHAGARRADVRVRHEPGWLEVEVVDDGRAVPTPGTRRGVGHLGIRERVAVHTGELDLGPRVGGGYRVRARLPLGDDHPHTVDHPHTDPGEDAP